MSITDIDFQEGYYRIKILRSAKEKKEAYTLRYRVFCEELGWISHNSSRQDMDCYDGNGYSLLGVYDITKSKLVALLRITLPNSTFMMEERFQFLLAEQRLEKGENVIEVSRVCTDTSIRRNSIENRFGTYSIAMLLYKGLFQWSQVNRITTMYMVIEEKLNRLLNISGFPSQTINEPYTMPDGVNAVAIKIDWRDFTEKNRKKRPHLLQWYTSHETPLPFHASIANLSVHHAQPLLQPDTDSLP